MKRAYCFVASFTKHEIFELVPPTDYITRPEVMATEIERKFLVADLFPFQKTTPIVQAYLSLDPARIVRVRIAGEFATVAIKGRKVGIRNLEFEYPIPVTDAQQLLAFSLGYRIEKTRHRCAIGAHNWAIDVYHGANHGLIVAEIDLPSESALFEQPEWLGSEVSNDPRYWDASLAQIPYSQWGSCS